jgi:hypothetical protein
VHNGNLSEVRGSRRNVESSLNIIGVSSVERGVRSRRVTERPQLTTEVSSAARVVNHNVEDTCKQSAFIVFVVNGNSCTE